MLYHILSQEDLRILKERRYIGYDSKNIVYFTDKAVNNINIQLKDDGWNPTVFPFVRKSVFGEKLFPDKSQNVKIPRTYLRDGVKISEMNWAYIDTVEFWKDALGKEAKQEFKRIKI